MTLQELDGESLLQCCGSRQWVEEMLGHGPFHDRETLLAEAESVWWGLTPSDWLEAFSAHPKIGAKKLDGWCSQEQSGVASAPDSMLERLAIGTEEYEKQFGWIFLISATGKTPLEMLDALRARIKNANDEELQVAAGEQAKITRLRLEKLLDR